MNAVDKEITYRYDRLIAFTSYYFATKAEEVLSRMHIYGRLIATPPAVHHMCGLCIVLRHEDIAAYIAALEEAHISHSGVYSYEGPKGTSIKLKREEYEKEGL